MRLSLKSPIFKLWFVFLIVGLWSSALFEIGLSLFIESLGTSLFVTFGGLFLISSFGFILSTRKIALRWFFAKNSALWVLYILYWLVSWCGVLYSSEGNYAFRDTLRYSWYSVLALLTIVVMRYFSIEERKKVLRWIGGVALIVLFYFTGRIFITGTAVNAAMQGERFTVAVFDDYNVFVFSMLVSVSLLFAGTKDAYVNGSFTKLLSYWGLVGLIVALGVFSGSRRAIVLYGPIAVLTPLYILSKRSASRFIARMFILSAIVLILFFVWSWVDFASVDSVLSRNLSDTAFTDIEMRLNRGLGFLTGKYADIDSRTLRWGRAFSVWQSYSFIECLIGRGTRSFYGEPEFIRTNGGLDHPHNFVLSALLEGGLIKALLIIAFVVVWICGIYRLSKRTDFWSANFLLSSSILWLSSVSISGREFFNSKQFLLLIIVYAIYIYTDIYTRRGVCEDPKRAAYCLK